jgi:hypothetical protein
MITKQMWVCEDQLKNSSIPLYGTRQDARDNKTGVIRKVEVEVLVHNAKSNRWGLVHKSSNRLDNFVCTSRNVARYFAGSIFKPVKVSLTIIPGR